VSSLAPATIATLVGCSAITIALIAAMAIMASAITAVGPGIPAICKLAAQRRVLGRLPDGPLTAEDAAKLLHAISRPGS
jgi:hypothetical protein